MVNKLLTDLFCEDLFPTQVFEATEIPMKFSGQGIVFCKKSDAEFVRHQKRTRGKMIKRP